MLLYILILKIFILNVSSQSIILGACKDDEFECDDGVCIPKAWQCDYEIDCANGEDERYDIDGNDCVPCEESGYFCENDPAIKCIPHQWKCDGWSDCPKGDDEEYCVPCTAHQFQCNDGKCIDVIQLCDFHNDCYGGEDERHDIRGDDCPTCQFSCDVDTCLTADKLCDGNFDCNDRTDECDTSICSINQPDECVQSTTPTVSPTSNNITDDINITPSPTHSELPISNIRDDTPMWKYCPNDIVWLGFVNSRLDNNRGRNTTAVYWIEPKVREEGKYYTKHSTSFNSGDHFSTGTYIVKYIAKKMIVNDTQLNGTETDTDDPIFCNLQILVLDGMRDYEIAECESQSKDDYVEWEFVVDDNNYKIAYFNIGEYESDIDRARFVPQNDKFHTDCYAKIAFETGIIQNEEQVIIEETVNWMVSHLYVFIGLIVGIVLLFIILLIIIIILWRKHVEMKEFIRADTYDSDEIGSSEDSDDENLNILDTKQRVPSTIDLDITTPGGIGYMSGNNSINQIPYITSSHSYSARSNGHKTQFEYNLNHLNNNMNSINMKRGNDNELSTNIDDISDSDSTSSDSDNNNENLIHLKTRDKNMKGKTPPRRSSILGVNYEQLKLLQNKDNKKKMDHDADKLLEAEWERESETSQGF